MKKTEFKRGAPDLDSINLNSTSNSSVPNEHSCDTSMEPQKMKYDQDYLDYYDLVIGISGKPVKKHIAEMEKISKGIRRGKQPQKKRSKLCPIL